MAQGLVKLYNSEYLIYESDEKIQRALRDDFKPYTIKSEIHRMCILENSNLILCSLLYDSCFYELEKDERVLKVYNNKGHDDNKETSKQFLILEMKINKEEDFQFLQHSFRKRKQFQRYRGPLSFEPARVCRTSLLSSESPEQNYRGFLNLAILILFANQLRLIVENFLKYGFLLKNLPYMESNYKESKTLLSALHILGNIVVCYLIQILQFKSNVSTKAILGLNFINMISMLIYPVVLIQQSHPFQNLFYLGFVLMFMLKLISYAHVMRTIRYAVERIKSLEGKKVPLNDFFKESEVSTENLEIIKKQIKKPVNLVNFQHFLYFLAAPTLCFQLSYPRSSRIRKLWLFKRFLELIGIMLLEIAIWYQYVEPILANTFKQYEQDNYKINYLTSLERLLKLAIPNTYLWIGFFFAWFQLGSNIVAELLRFGDRQFYLDWWNCKNLEEYWKLWNLPVHNWLVRHLYFPLQKRGINKVAANLIVFLVSAISHEFIVSASIGVLEYWAFFGILMQAPVIVVQKKFETMFKLQNSQLGNLMFWISFCFLGQPLMIFVYYYSFLKKSNSTQ